MTEAGIKYVQVIKFAFLRTLDTSICNYIELNNNQVRSTLYIKKQYTSNITKLKCNVYWL